MGQQPAGAPAAAELAYYRWFRYKGGGAITHQPRTRDQALKKKFQLLVLKILQLIFGRRHMNLVDLYFGYRIFFNRPPDPEGWLTHWNFAARPRHSVGWLTEIFLRSQEFQNRLGQQSVYDTVPIQETLVELKNFKLYVDVNDSQIGGLIARRKTWEPHVTKALQSVLAPGQVFLDVGANVGYFTMMAAAIVGPQGKVLAVEPFEHNYRLLQKSMEENGFDNIELFKCAAMDQSQSVTFSLGSRYNSGSFHLGDEGRDYCGTYEVPAHPVDELVGERKVDVVKIDVEGAESFAFSGMQKTIERGRPIIVMEYSQEGLAQVSGVDGEELLRGFEQRGYAMQEVQSFNKKPFTPWSVDQVTQALVKQGTDHIDLILFPAEAAAG